MWGCKFVQNPLSPPTPHFRLFSQVGRWAPAGMPKQFTNSEDLVRCLIGKVGKLVAKRHGRISVEDLLSVSAAAKESCRGTTSPLVLMPCFRLSLCLFLAIMF